MANNLTILFLIAHFLADYYLQPQTMPATTTARYAGVLLHSSIYFTLFGLICLFENDLVIPVGVVVVSHLLIDSSQNRQRPPAHGPQMVCQVQDQKQIRSLEPAPR